MSNRSTTEDVSHPFQADVARLLDLLVHSVYSSRDIFVRELISNGSDACEKLRFEAIRRPELLGDDPNPAVTIVLDKEGGQFVVEDNGVGMSERELVERLGTIADSGTRKYLDSLKEAAADAGDGEAGPGRPDAEALIGQFGIGFYSAFMVADRVDVISRKAGSQEAWLWSSAGRGEFTVAPAKGVEAPARGTRVILHLSVHGRPYLDPQRVESIVREHSSAISCPIYLRDAPEEAPRRLSDGLVLWARPKASISDEDYAELYRDLSGQRDSPAHVVHWRAEGRQDYTALAFVPGSKPLDLFDPERRSRARLYVRRILINRNSALLPGWLRFVKLIVDSVDLPLNVSRETVQESALFAAIKRGVESRLIQEFVKLSEAEPEKWLSLWENFGPILKEGLYEEPSRQDDIFKLARFHADRCSKLISLKDYVSALRPNQTSIYYLAGADKESLKANPFLEGYRARGIEVLLLSDPIDLFWTANSEGYDGKPFKSIAQGSADIGAIPYAEGEEAPVADILPQVATLIAFMKQTLESAVADVRPSLRLKSSPVGLVGLDGGIDRRLQRLIASQAQRSVPLAKAVLEVNPQHSLIKSMAKRFAESPDKDALTDAAWVLLDQARLLDQEAISDVTSFAERVTRLLSKAME